MELFTLGADRGAYSQHDVHEQARALTGFTNDWNEARARATSASIPTCTTTGVKTIFGHRGRFGWRDTCRLCVEHPLHPSFMVSKLWGYFIGEPPSAGDAARARAHRTWPAGIETRPLLEAILRHPLLLRRPADGHPARRLLRRAAARARPHDRDRRLGLDRRSGRPAAVRAAQRGRLGLRALAGHLALGRALHRGHLCPAGPRRSTRGQHYPAHETRGPRPCETALQPLGQSAALRGDDPRISAGLQPPGAARDHRRLGAGHLPHPAPERAARR